MSTLQTPGQSLSDDFQVLTIVPERTQKMRTESGGSCGQAKTKLLLGLHITPPTLRIPLQTIL